MSANKRLLRAIEAVCHEERKKTLRDVAEYFREMQQGADAIGNGHIRWPSFAAEHVEILLGREESK